MNRFLLLSLVFLLSSCALAQDVEVRVQNDQIKIFMANTIKQMSVYKINNAQNSKTVDSVLVRQAFLEYDGKGSVKMDDKIINRKKSDELVWTFRFNKNGKTSKFSVFNDKNKFSEIQEYKYDEYDRLVNTLIYDKDSLNLSLSQRFYDKDGRCMKIMKKRDALFNHNSMRVFMSSKLLLSDSLFYDKNGELNEDRQYDSQGVSNRTFFYEYTGTDEKTVTVTEQYGGTQYVVSKSKFNKYGLIVSSMESPFINPFESSVKDESIWKYFYNTDGTINIAISYYNGKVKEYLKYYYTKE